MPMGVALLPYWIERTDAPGTLGFGVTAWSEEDALALIRVAGFSIDPDRVIIHRNVVPHDIDPNHVAPNSGPQNFRGMWFPCMNLGSGASGQR